MSFAKKIIRLAVAVLGTLAAAAAGAQEIKPIQLTEAQVTGFFAVQKDLAAILAKSQTAEDKPDPAQEAEFESVAKKNGFASYADYSDVAATVSVVMSYLDTKTGEVVDPTITMQKDLEDARNDKSVTEEERKAWIAETEEAIKTAKSTPMPSKANLDLLRAHRADIEKLLAPEATPPTGR